jgi:hypothetical protein
MAFEDGTEPSPFGIRTAGIGAEETALDHNPLDLIEADFIAPSALERIPVGFISRAAGWRRGVGGR